MHPRRLLRKGVEDARPAAEAHSELLTFANRAMPRVLRLAQIGEVMAAPTGEDSAPPKIELGDASAAASPICASGALKPGSGAAEMAPGPCDRHALSATVKSTAVDPKKSSNDADKLAARVVTRGFPW